MLLPMDTTGGGRSDTGGHFNTARGGHLDTAEGRTTSLPVHGCTTHAQKATNPDSARRETAGADTIDRHSLTECRTATFDHQQ